jgi:DNA adenine methylase
MTRTISAPLLPFDGPAALSLMPALKWAGGKVWQRPRILPFWLAHAHRRLVEPCCGALGMTLGLQPTRALLNDSNPHLVNFHTWVQRGLTIDLVMQNDERLYYASRDRFNALVAGPERTNREAASLFYFLNQTGFNGLCRFNKQGQFNVPFGERATVTYRRDFSDYQVVYAPWTFTTGDFEQVLLEPEDFVYFDPPYDTDFTEYAPDGFSWEDQVRLVTWLRPHPGPVVLCNQATARIVALYQGAGFHLDFVDAPRRISCTGDRRPAAEIIATRNL